jgi:hypothetical protein
MRITAQMMAAVEQKAGITSSRKSILDYMNENSSSLLDALKPDKETKTDSTNVKKYEQQKEAADRLMDELDKLTSGADDSIFARAAESGSTEELCSETKALVEACNSLLTASKSGAGALEKLYVAALKEAAADNEEELSELGISINSDGSLSVSEDKLSKVSYDTFKSIIGGDSDFMVQLALITTKIGSNARANLESYSSSYNAVGSSSSLYSGRFNIRA